MARQLSVLAQNAEPKERMHRIASEHADGGLAPWLPALLRAHRLNPGDGCLIQYKTIPDQAGLFAEGVWITRESKFWRFQVTVRSDVLESAPAVELFEDTTRQTVISSGRHGTGKSVGQLATEVARERGLTRSSGSDA